MKWEYKAVNAIKKGSLSDFLNEFGELGWELIYYNSESLFIFKRPIIDTQSVDIQHMKNVMEYFELQLIEEKK